MHKELLQTHSQPTTPLFQMGNLCQIIQVFMRAK
jgi:hypothetical protein